MSCSNLQFTVQRQLEIRRHTRFYEDDGHQINFTGPNYSTWNSRKDRDFKIVRKTLHILMYVSLDLSLV